MRPSLRRLWRVPALTAVILAGLLLAVLARVVGGAEWFLRASGERLVQTWMRVLNWVIGLRVRIRCQPLEAPTLIVANHVSWLDVPALAAVVPTTFVAKADVRGWPWLGRLAGLAGTQFLDRGSLAAVRPLLDALSARLRAGHACTVFPEGTSTAGDRVRPFFPALFQAAIDAGCPVQPVAIEYGADGARDELAPFTGDQDFAGHLWRLLGRPHTEVALSFLAPCDTRGAERRNLARRAQASVEQWLFADLAQLKRAVG